MVFSAGAGSLCVSALPAPCIPTNRFPSRNTPPPLVTSHQLLRPLIAPQIWTIDDGYQFDNIYVGRDASEAEALRKEVWQPKFAAKVRGER